MRLLIVSEGAHELSGALPRLVDRLLDTQIEHDVEDVKSKQVRRHFHPGRGDEYEKRFVAWIIEAEERGYNGVVIVVDQDGKRERERGADRAQATLGVDLRRAIGVAIRTFDAWMIADETAWNDVLGVPVDRSPDPEGISDPKEFARERLASTGSDLRLRDCYAKLADVANLPVLERRCKRGFKPFAERVRALTA